ncbi:MAG: serine--tRNA ligase [Candidatus Aminicenantes bacterium]|nr:serine--tRNA ligase [Candidatus Aminicenantes bacterium]
MLDLKWVLDNAPEARRRLARRGADLDADGLARLQEERKALQKRVEDLRAERNKASEGVACAKREGRGAADVIAAMKKVGDEISALEEKVRVLEERLRSELLNIPNLPDDGVPDGSGAGDNVEVRRFGEPPRFAFDVEPHWEIGRRLGLLDFDRAAKIAGARFAVSLDAGARLERALINFMLDIHTRESGFTEILPPFIANEDSLTGTGNLPKFAADLFKLEGYTWYLIPTAEVPLTNYFRDEVLEADSLPRRFAAYTPCFRSEAGSYGKDIRGLIRQHQFNKVEMMVFSLPERSFEELEKMTASAEEVLRRLELPHRVVSLCAGDLGFAGAKTYDLEVWMPERSGFVEISSCSNCTDFQARRANIRFRRGPKTRPEYVHTLNGSGVAVGRTVAALLECGQQKDGSVRLPEALRPYMGGLEKIG